MNRDEIIDWLLKGDVSIQYQVHKDLLGTKRSDLQTKIATEGWGQHFLAQRTASGHWGQSFYQPKWISTHYTLLDLRNMYLAPDHPTPATAILMVLNDGKAEDGGIPLGPSTALHSDVCVNAMFLNYASYFQTKEQALQSIVDSILAEIMPDGGFNCQSTRSGATHSSLHSTISVLEGLNQFLNAGHNYRKQDILRAISSAEEFVLLHQLFISDRTGQIIKKEFLKLSYPSRWKFDILRGLDYFRYSGHAWDERMAPAIEVLLSKRNKHGSWNMQAAHAGQVHLVMEKAGLPGRWNTLRAMRVLKHFERD